MKKLNLRNLSLEGKYLLSKEQLKSILGGNGSDSIDGPVRDGFDCAPVYEHCDFFKDYNSFQACMGARGC